MLYRRLGRTGLQLSALSFGAWVTFGRRWGARRRASCWRWRTIAE